MVIMPPTMLEVAVPTFAGVTAADVPVTDWNAVVESAATLAADGNAVVEPTAALEPDGSAIVESRATLEATTAAMQASASAIEATAATIEATAGTIKAAAIETTAAVKAAAATASGVCRAGQNHRATQRGGTCGEFPHEVHGCRNSTPCHACSIVFVQAPTQCDSHAGVATMLPPPQHTHQLLTRLAQTGTSDGRLKAFFNPS
jgi:hypothetical protein